jgi:hypothetical protein
MQDFKVPLGGFRGEKIKKQNMKNENQNKQLVTSNF